MKIEIKVPAMGESISEATVGEILKKSGSTISANEELIELETEKVNQMLYAQASGTIQWHISTGDTVRIGQIIGTIETNGKSSTETKDVQKKSQEPKQVKEEVSTSAAQITKESFLAELNQPKKEKVPVAQTSVCEEEHPEGIAQPQVKEQLTRITTDRELRQKMPKIRQVIARRMVEAQQTTAMLTTFNEVDMSAVIALRERYKEEFVKIHGVRLGFMSFFAKATVEALKQFPDLNSYIDGEDIVRRLYYDIGIAVGTDKGVFVPVIKNCDQLAFHDIEKMIEHYAKKVKEGKIALEDLTGGGFTITNGGVYGSLLSTPILNPPQSGILGMHKIEKRPVVVDDQVVIRPMMYLALSYDHRIVDGKGAVSFLVTLKKYLEDPSRFVLKM